MHRLHYGGVGCESAPLGQVRERACCPRQRRGGRHSSRFAEGGFFCDDIRSNIHFTLEQPIPGRDRYQSRQFRAVHPGHMLRRSTMNVFSTTPSQRQLGLGLLVLRLALGLVFIVHGGQKLFVIGLSGSAGMLANMGVPGASVIGPLLAVVEPLAGVAVVLGLLTRLAALGIAMDMLGAIMLFHRLHGFFVPMGIEFPMMLCAAGLALVALG